MGLMQRNKGKRFERAIAAELRATFPDAIVRRASQADRAGNSDVFVSGHTLLERLWLELTDQADATLLSVRPKLFQAEDDVVRARAADRWPVVVWHRTRDTTIWATMRLHVLALIACYGTGGDGGVRLAHPAAIVTLSWRELLMLVDGATQG